MIRPLAVLAAAALALSVPATSAEAANRPPKGSTKVKVVSVTDGDTIRVRYQGRSTPVRVIGINTPELNPRQCYGREATTRMKQLTKSGSVYLKNDRTQGNRDRYGRLLRHLYSPGGRSLAVIQLTEGYAREYTYSRAYAGQYTHRRAQASAKAKKRGLWRACAGKPTVKPRPTSCVGKIKGNISSSGRIYHLPGQRHYSVTKIDLTKGERWFCTEAQARTAGWRKART